MPLYLMFQESEKEPEKKLKKADPNIFHDPNRNKDPQNLFLKGGACQVFFLILRFPLRTW